MFRRILSLLAALALCCAAFPAAAEGAEVPAAAETETESLPEGAEAETQAETPAGTPEGAEAEPQTETLEEAEVPEVPEEAAGAAEWAEAEEEDFRAGGAGMPEAAGPAEALSAAEVDALAARILAMAEGTQPLNDPASEDARSEDGVARIYDFATVYTETAEAGAACCAVVLQDLDTLNLRGVETDMRAAWLLSAFRCDNPTLDGTRAEALLYLDGDPENGFSYGRVSRDGQRITAVEYGAAVPAEGGFALRTASYTVQTDLVSRLRLDGLAGTADPETLRGLYAELEALGRETGYTLVPSETDGLKLAPFSPADLRFEGIDFQTLRPEDLGSLTEQMLIDNEDGTWLLVVDGDGFRAVFSCDANGRNTSPMSFTFLSEELEGPRGVRLGDQFHEDFCRFRNGENEMDPDRMTEVLYGTEGIAPWGTADYADADGMSLRFVTAMEDGRLAELYLHYVANELYEIILHIL